MDSKIPRVCSTKCFFARCFVLSRLRLRAAGKKKQKTVKNFYMGFPALIELGESKVLATKPHRCTNASFFWVFFFVFSVHVKWGQSPRCIQRPPTFVLAVGCLGFYWPSRINLADSRWHAKRPRSTLRRRKEKGCGKIEINRPLG